MRNYTLSIFVLGVLLAGCGGSGAGSSASTGATASPAKHGGAEVEDNANARGPASNINAADKTLSITEKIGTFPLNAVVSVSTLASTRYRNAAGIDVSASTFFATIKPGQVVEAEGAKGTGNTLTATKLKLQN